MNSSKTEFSQTESIIQATESCELTLSADKKWLRLVVGGKQIVSFHVNYVNLVLGNLEKAPYSKLIINKPDDGPTI